MKASKCINCGEIPAVHYSGEDEFPYVISHKEGGTCPSQFRLTAYHTTKENCIKKWNEFNVRSKK